MDQIKAFISHSSDDALYVDVLINLIGKNSLVVDRFCFESGERTIDEIIKSIDNSAIFIVLLSRSSLDKDWVKKELAIIKKYIDSGVLKRFKPYIIDDTISYKYEKIPEWIKEEYNLRNIYIQPPFLARKIEEEVNKLIWEQCPDIRQDERVFVGRDTEIERLREKYLQRNLKDRKAVIVSGIPDGIGRRRLLTEFIRKIDTNKDETYDPFSVAMEEDDSIEDFIIQLNNLFFFERNEDLLQRISIINKTEKVNKVVEFICYLSELREKLFIRDNGSIVRRNGELSSWFKDVIKSNKIDQTILFIASRNRFVLTDEYPEIVSLHLTPLNNDKAKTLLRQYLNNHEKTISGEDVSFFIQQTGPMPNLIRRCASLILEMGPELAKLKQKKYQYTGDELTRNLISDFQKDKSYIQILILLSEFPYLRYYDIKQITSGIVDNVDQILLDLYSLSIFETFGSSNDYYRMNPILADLINRSRYKHDETLWGELRFRTHNIIEHETFECPSLGVLLKKIELNIKGNTNNISKAYIIPSIVIKTINDEYRKKTKSGYKNVIQLCKALLEIGNNNYYDEIIGSIYYMLCSAYAQLGDDTLYDFINFLDDKFDEYFIKGLFFRKKKQYERAEANYREALKIRHNSLTAKNGLAISLQRQDKYNREALNLARFTYNQQPTNPYFIVTYFKSLIRTNPDQTIILNQLIKDLRSSWDINKESFGDMLQAEYVFFIEHDFNRAISIYKDTLRKNPLYPVFISLHEICSIYQKRCGIGSGIASEIAKRYHFDVDNDDSF